MTNDWLERTELLLGGQKLALVRQAHVLVVGLGGVGAYAAEMLTRSGIGRLTIVDADCVSPSNLNRQLVALHSTIGRPKAEVLAERLCDINPQITLDVVREFIKDDATDALLDRERFDYVIDAIDTLAPKARAIHATSGQQRSPGARHSVGQFDGCRSKNRPYFTGNKRYFKIAPLSARTHAAQKTAQTGHS